MTKPPIPTENSKTKGQHTQTPQKTSITQRLRTDLNCKQTAKSCIYPLSRYQGHEIGGKSD